MMMKMVNAHSERRGDEEYLQTWPSKQWRKEAGKEGKPAAG
jgi:hypothetical protein